MCWLNGSWPLSKHIKIIACVEFLLHVFDLYLESVQTQPVNDGRNAGGRFGQHHDTQRRGGQPGWGGGGRLGTRR